MAPVLPPPAAPVSQKEATLVDLKRKKFSASERNFTLNFAYIKHTYTRMYGFEFEILFSKSRLMYATPTKRNNVWLIDIPLISGSK